MSKDRDAGAILSHSAIYLCLLRTHNSGKLIVIVEPNVARATVHPMTRVQAAV